MNAHFSHATADTLQDTKLEQLLSLIKTDREQFRAQAMHALSQFAQADRQVANQLTADDIGVQDVLATWEHTVLPMRTQLHAKRGSETLRKSLAKHLYITEEDADLAVDRLVAEREQQLLEETLEALYPYPKADQKDSYESQRAAATQFLSRPDEEIEAFKDRFQSFLHHVHAAHSQNVTVCDPFASWVERRKCALQVRKERKRTQLEEQARLVFIDRQLQELERRQDGLLHAIVKRGWDFVSLIDLRQQYERKIAALSEDDAKSPAKRLRVFDQITHDFRDTETEKLAHGSPHAGLKAMRQISEEIDSLLLHIFDLDNAAKNALLLDMKQYRTLMQERDMILLLQKNRHVFSETT